MSKVDALRALREARYARLAAAAPPQAVSTPRRPAAPRPPAAPQEHRAEATAAEVTCGHRNMSGRACTREADHAKAGTRNHRYA